MDFVRDVTPIKMIKWSAATLVLGLVCWFGCSWLASRLPSPASRAEVHAEPVQIDRVSAPFDVQRDSKTWHIVPLADYELHGLVVTLSSAHDLLNIMHKDAGDNLNSHDFCTVWAHDAEELDFRAFDFWHGDFTCYAQSHSMDAWNSFRPDQLSNTHVIPATDEMAHLFDTVRIGDEIAIKGQLVDYGRGGHIMRMTSLSRTDTNESSRSGGACEVMYVTDFRFLHRHNPSLYRLAAAGEGVSLGALIVLVFSLFVLPFIWPLTRRAE